MEITVRQGNMAVLQTGSVLVINREHTELTLDGGYTITLTYTDDPQIGEQKIHAEPHDGGVTLELINFNNPAGSATSKPIAIATVGSQTIYITLAVTAISTTKLLTYGLYLE